MGRRGTSVAGGRVLSENTRNQAHYRASLRKDLYGPAWGYYTAGTDSLWGRRLSSSWVPQQSIQITARQGREHV